MDSHPFTLLLGAVLLLLALVFSAEALGAADRLTIGAGAGPVHHFHRWW